MGIRHHRNSGATLRSQSQQTTRQRSGFLLEFFIGKHCSQFTDAIIKVKSGFTFGGYLGLGLDGLLSFSAAPLRAATGLGLVLASTLLTLIQFPTEATPGEISAGTIPNLGIAYVPALVVPWTLMMLCLSLYSINRARHEENLRKLGRG